MKPSNSWLRPDQDVLTFQRCLTVWAWRMTPKVNTTKRELPLSKRLGSSPEALVFTITWPPVSFDRGSKPAASRSSKKPWKSMQEIQRLASTLRPFTLGEKNIDAH